MRVLIVEDEPVSRKMLESILPMWGYEVATVGDGEEAWEILQTPEAPRLVILDWMMPGIDGIELTRLLRDQKGHHYTFVLLLTSKSSKEDLVEGLEAGADDFLSKPFDPQELRVRMNAARRAILAHDQLEKLAGELARKNRKLGELTETAHRFVDDVSHEFRTPLTVIKEYTSIIADGLGGPVTDTQGEYLGTITQAVLDLAQMVDDLLDSSKLKSGTLRVDRRPLTVGEIVDAALTLVTSKARAKGIDLRTDIEPGLGEVFADREKSARILVNLLVNAIKFSPAETPVTLSAKSKGGEVELAVTDQGPGLTQEQLDVIFDRFQQVGAPTASAGKGFGIGLNIVRELTWLNLGSIAVASRPGEGSRFAFTLPINDPAVIFAHFVDRLAELETPRVRIACLRLAPRGGAGSIAELHRFATASCYPTDLVLDCPDDDGVLAIGLTDSARDWRERLLRLRARAIDENPGEPLPPLDVTCEGAWPFPSGAKAMSALVQEARTRRTACA